MPSTPLRQQLLVHARRAVVKLGTNLLTDDAGHVDLPFLRQIARQVMHLRRRGVQVTLVSSGAVGAGMAALRMPQRPRDIPDQQAVAAIGQPLLMTLMRRAFATYRVPVGQLLLTRSDFEDRTRFLNIRNALTRLHAHGCIAVVNENDSVSIDELRFGDNDMLAALIANAVRADALVLLSVIDGLLDGRGKVIDLVQDAASAQGLAWSSRSRLGTGGMASKLEAAGLVAKAGEVAVIANGREPNVLPRLFAGERLGTVLAPAQRKLNSRRRWIGLTKRPMGAVTVDDGAVKALTSGGKSLLASGIVAVHGRFPPGAALVIQDAQGRPVARGLTNFNHEELTRIMGHRSSQFEKILGRRSHAEVIHRDNLTLLGS